ncbi:hypothetical protein B566_EDAN013427 [Ephemera danica]|nr:hypothetical protein B566_EDAN013427 [Ephemera danica]
MPRLEKNHVRLPIINW